jgi:hypothetical protein
MSSLADDGGACSTSDGDDHCYGGGGPACVSHNGAGNDGHLLHPSPSPMQRRRCECGGGTRSCHDPAHHPSASDDSETIEEGSDSQHDGGPRNCCCRPLAGSSGLHPALLPQRVSAPRPLTAANCRGLEDARTYGHVPVAKARSPAPSWGPSPRHAVAKVAPLAANARSVWRDARPGTPMQWCRAQATPGRGGHVAPTAAVVRRDPNEA